MPQLHSLPAFEDNYIWALENAHGEVLAVDPGDAEPLLALLAEGRRLRAILITHHHPDHIGGLPRLRSLFAVPIHAPPDPRIPVATDRVAGGQRIAVEGFDSAFDVIEVPGHTRSHVAYCDGDRVFCGDTLFSLGCGRLFEGTAEQMLASLDRLAGLPGDTEVCCTHEYTLANAAFALQVDPDNPQLRERVSEARAQRAAGQSTLPTRIADERQCNPFLRIDAPAVRDAIDRHEGRNCSSRVERFAALRRWKDGFRG